jgi:hypothetical protein
MIEGLLPAWVRPRLAGIGFKCGMIEGLLPA